MEIGRAHGATETGVVMEDVMVTVILVQTALGGAQYSAQATGAGTDRMAVAAGGRAPTTKVRASGREDTKLVHF